jgi:hypothetical protein
MYEMTPSELRDFNKRMAKAEAAPKPRQTKCARCNGEPDEYGFTPCETGIGFEVLNVCTACAIDLM